MYFQKLRLNHFRNLTSLDVEFSKGVNIFLGLNGQGKTNILEALYLLSQGQSFRYGDNEAFIEKGFSEAVVSAQIHQKDLDFNVSLQILKSKKNFFLQNKKTYSNEIRSRFPSIIFSPESLAAIKEGADLRRQLIDDLIVLVKPQNATLIADFRKALKARNKVLRDGLEPLADKNQTVALLESINPSFFRLATQLTMARVNAINDISADFTESLTGIMGKNVDISVEYVISSEKAAQFSEKQVADLLQNRALELRVAELSSGASLVGPQKNDVAFIYNGNDSRFFCSQGQQRALILSFKMAQIVYHRRVHGAYPVLMLDDVLSELDQEKKKALLGFVQEINTQIFITTTDLDFPLSLEKNLKMEGPTVYKIADGQILERSAL